MINGKIVKIKSDSCINVILNEKYITSINCKKECNLVEVRNLLNKSIKNNFIFLDQDGNEIENIDEKEYPLEDILKNNNIKLTNNSLNDSPPAVTSLDITKKDGNEIKKENKTIKGEKDLSKYKLIRKEKSGLMLYKYSNIEKKMANQLVNQYYYDKYNVDDEHDAYVVLFCGKTGEGKTTAINAFFNIIKGVKIEDDYRFILINEEQPKNQGQSESQTNGIHLYYLKDYNGKPIILIDSQGYGDTRGQIYDEMLNEAFRYAFTNLIDHINAVCFILKSSNCRLDINTKYIYSSVTSLFSDDINENFIILGTFADQKTIYDGPLFVDSIKKDAAFLKLQDRLNERWWYAINAICILDNDSGRLNKYSFEQMTKLYEDKIKKLWPKSIKNCSKVLETRHEIKVQINSLKETFKKLLIEIENIKEKENDINKKNDEISYMEKQILDIENNSKELEPQEIEKKYSKLNKDLNEKLFNLNNEYERQWVEFYEKSDKINTICLKCKVNCHNPCDCYLTSLNRCTRFTWGIVDDKKCECCNCPKSDHKIDYYCWTFKKVKVKKHNYNEIENEKLKNQKEKEEFYKKIINEKSVLENEKRKLNYNKNKLLEEKKKY